MSCYRQLCVGRCAVFAVGLFCSSGMLLTSGCTDLKRAIGLEKTSPDEFAVESRAPLEMPPDFDLRPPQPGASRPQEKSPDKLARQVIETAGPGEPGKQAPDFRLRRSEDGLPDIGAPSGQRPDASAAVSDQSLSRKLLDYQAGGDATAPVEKRETTPLKGVY